MTIQHYCTLLLLIVQTLFTTTVFAEDTIDQLVDRVVVAYGGSSALIKPQLRKETGKTVSFIRNTEGKITRQFVYPDLLRIDIDYGNAMVEHRVLNHDRTYKDGVEAMPMLRLAILLQAARMDLPRLLLEHRASIQDKGMVANTNANPLRQLAIPLNDIIITTDIDTQTGRIMASTGTTMSNSRALQFSTAYSNFTTIDNRLLALKEDHYVMGNHIGYTQLELVTYSDIINNALFSPRP